MEEEHLGRDEVNGGTVGGTMSWVDGKVEEEKAEEIVEEHGGVDEEEMQGDEETEDEKDGGVDEEETQEEDGGVEDEEMQEEVESDGEWLPVTKRRRLK